MPGKTVVFSNASDRVALWGDSQAEGVSVRDHEKIFAIAESIGPTGFEVFPLAQSGDDASDWLPQFSWAERTLHVDTHVVLLTELSDLAAITRAAPRTTKHSLDWVAEIVPAFVIQSARNLLMDPSGQTVRSIRFSPGRVGKRHQDDTREIKPPLAGQAKEDWGGASTKLLDATEHPVILIYAPRIPLIAGGKIQLVDPEAKRFGDLKAACELRGITVVDLSDEFRLSAASGRYPHGFHNGVFGSGHLNQTGNRIVAQAMVDGVSQKIEQHSTMKD